MNNFYEAYGTLLYHRQLRALVALEREDWEFEPEYIDKMQFYLSEGVEHEDQMQMLQDLDCDCIQGFLLSQPSSSDTIEASLNKTRASPK